MAFLEHAALGVDDPPVQRRAEDRLRLDADRAQLAVLEVALLLDGREQSLVGEVPFAEVPAERPSRRRSRRRRRCTPGTGCPPIALRQQQAEDPALQVQRAKGQQAAVGLRRLLARAGSAPAARAAAARRASARRASCSCRCGTATRSTPSCRRSSASPPGTRPATATRLPISGRTSRRDHQVERQRHRADVEQAHLGMADEEEERGVDAEHVPLEDGGDRQVAEDEAVQHERRRTCRATSSGPGSVTKSSVSGAANSRNVPACAIAFASRDGVQVVGVGDEQAPAQRRALQQRDCWRS